MSAPIPAHSSSNDTEGMLTDAAVTKVRMAKNSSMASVEIRRMKSIAVMIHRHEAQRFNGGNSLRQQSFRASQVAETLSFR